MLTGEQVAAISRPSKKLIRMNPTMLKSLNWNVPVCWGNATMRRTVATLYRLPLMTCGSHRASGSSMVSFQNPSSSGMSMVLTSRLLYRL